MREVNYRAWDGERLRLVWGLSWIDGELDTVNTPKYHGPVDEDVVIMQYTGLKDNNGVEIYEGDVLDYYCGGTKQDRPYEVESAFKIWEDIGIGQGDSYYRMSGFEIIGNLYENPELIEKVGEKS